MKLPLRALLVDDERPARRWLGELLQAHTDITLVGEADSVESARELLHRLQPDIVFLDVQMPPATGFDLLPDLPAGVRVIFVTAYDNFAVRAFDANALDYLLKPVHPQRLAETVARLRTVAGNVWPDSKTPHDRLAGFYSPLPARLSADDLLPLKDRHLLRMVPVRQVAAIRAEGAYTQISISGQEPMMVLYAIGDWEARLPAPPFIRLDRSRLLNLDRVVEARVIDRNQTCVRLDRVSSAFVLGRSASRRLRDYLRNRQSI